MRDLSHEKIKYLIIDGVVIGVREDNIRFFPSYTIR